MHIRLTDYPPMQSMYPGIKKDYQIGELIHCLVYESVYDAVDKQWTHWFLLEAKSKVRGVHLATPDNYDDYILYYRSAELPIDYSNEQLFWANSDYVSVDPAPTNNKEAAIFLSRDL